MRKSLRSQKIVCCFWKRIHFHKEKLLCWASRGGIQKGHHHCWQRRVILTLNKQKTRWRRNKWFTLSRPSRDDQHIHPPHKIIYLQQQRHGADIIFDGAACDRLWPKKNEPFTPTEWRSLGHVLLESPDDAAAGPGSSDAGSFKSPRAWCQTVERKQLVLPTDEDEQQHGVIWRGKLVSNSYHAINWTPFF